MQGRGEGGNQGLRATGDSATFSEQIRWSGWPTLLSGVLVLAVMVLDIFTVDFGNLGNEATGAAFGFYAALSLIASVLLLMGLVGLYLHQARNVHQARNAVRLLGLGGFLGAFIGTALVVGAFWAQTFGAPTLATMAPEIVSEEPSWWLGRGFTLSLWWFALGWILFGVATLQAEVYPRPSVILLITGAVLLLLPIPYTQFVFAIAICWMGIFLLRKRGAN